MDSDVDSGETSKIESLTSENARLQGTLTFLYFYSSLYKQCWLYLVSYDTEYIYNAPRMYHGVTCLQQHSRNVVCPAGA